MDSSLEFSENQDRTAEDIDVLNLAKNIDTENKQKRKCTSAVWLEFKKVKNENGEVAICNHCKHKLVGSSKAGTTHLRNHLKSCTQRSHKDVGQLLISTSKNLKDGTHSVGSFAFDDRLSREDLAHMIILHEYPFSMVEHFGFKRFVSRLQPKFTMVSRATIKNDIMEIYSRVKQKVYEQLDKIQSRICVTTDMWTSCQNKGYLVLTAHFIDESWVLEKRILRYVHVPPLHNTENLTNILYESFLDWNIDRKLCTITMDNASVNDSTVVCLRDRLSPYGYGHELLLGGKIFHVRCCAHILNLIVQYGLEEIRGIIQKVRDSVSFWTKSPSRQEIFNKAVKDLKISCKKSLCLDVATRWNSTFSMLETALEYKEAFARCAARDKNYTCEPSKDDWQRAHVICKHLKVFYDTTNAFSSTKVPTANIYFRHICDIKLDVEKWGKLSPYDFVRSMASKMREKMNKYWDTCRLPLAITSVLDPQYKLLLVVFYYREIYGENAVEAIEEVKKNLEELYDEYKVKWEMTQSDSFSHNASNLSKGESSYGASDDYATKDNDYDTTWSRAELFDTFANKEYVNQQLRTELDRYLDEGKIARSEDFNVLQWWKMHNHTYPILSMIARDLLCILVSTVASESAFSTGGRVVNQYRNRLHQDTIEALMCTQDWLRNEFDGAHDISSVRATISACHEAFDSLDMSSVIDGDM